MAKTESSLCCPDDQKTCFACCPPIRPAAYEHIEFKNMIKRILRENTASIDRQDGTVIPIRGYSCWALGYLDRGHKLVGCLLHPAQNRGVDLRFRVDYAGKCSRETCQEAVVFSVLGEEEKTFWLHLADGLDSFSYSSRKANPLFALLGWGKHILSLIPQGAGGRTFTAPSFFTAYPFFSTPVAPKANAYLMNRLVERKDLHLLENDLFRKDFERLSARIAERLSRMQPAGSAGPYVHRLPIDPDFLNLLRLSARIPRITLEGAIGLKEMVDGELDQFRSSLQ